MLVIILQIYTNSLQYTQISIETIFDQIPTYSLFSQIWYSSIFDHFPTSENFSIKYLFVHFLAKFGIIAFSIIFRNRKTFRSYSYFFYFSLSIIFLLRFSIKFRLQFSIKFCFPIYTIKTRLMCAYIYICLYVQN